MDHMDLVELAPCMGPASRLIYMVAVQMMKAGIGVCLQSTLEVLQVMPWMFALAIFRVCEPDSRCSRFAGRPVVAHVGPETSGLGLAAAGSEHRYRRVVSVQLAPAKHVLLNRIYKWTEQIAHTTYPASQRRAGYINSLAAVNLRLSIQRKMVCELRDDHMGQQ